MCSRLNPKILRSSKLIGAVKIILFGFVSIFSVSIFAEQYVYGEIERIDVVNYNEGAAYIFFKNAEFNECPRPTNWCAIDFSVKSGNQMYSAVLAAKMSGKKVGITTNSCWSGGQYARCWKVHIHE